MGTYPSGTKRDLRWYTSQWTQPDQLCLNLFFFNSHKGDILGYKTFNAIWVCLKLEWGISTYILLFVIVPIRIANLGFLSLFWTNSRSCWYFINELFRYGYQLIWLRIQIMLVSIWLRICIGIIHSIFRSSRFR